MKKQAKTKTKITNKKSAAPAPKKKRVPVVRTEPNTVNEVLKLLYGLNVFKICYATSRLSQPSDFYFWLEPHKTSILQLGGKGKAQFEKEFLQAVRILHHNGIRTFTSTKKGYEMYVYIFRDPTYDPAKTPLKKFFKPLEAR